MKANLSRMLRSGVAMLLVLCMVASFVPAAAFAAGTVTPGWQGYGEVADPIYVALGDSMANGYGLGNGYDSNGVGGSNGYNEICTLSYPYLVAEHYGWNLVHLATSAMRIEDLHYILDVGTEDAYQGDAWTQSELVNHGGRWNSTNAGGEAKVAAHFQNSVRDAKVISMAMGNANFGVYLMDMITTTLGIGGYGIDHSYCTLENALELLKFDAQTKALVMSIYDELLAYLSAFIPADMAKTLADRMSYVVTSFLLSYEGAMDRIVELNPDAEIIIVGLVNTMSGFELDITNQGEKMHLDMADVLDIILNPVNAYLAGLPTVKQALGSYAEAKLYYAELDRIETQAQTFKDYYKDYENGIRSRFVNDIVGGGYGLIWGMLAPTMGLQVIGLEDIKAYENAVYGADGNNDLAAQVDGIQAFMATKGAEYGAAFLTLPTAEQQAIIEEQIANGATTVEEAAEAWAASKVATHLTSVNAYLTFENAILTALENTPNVDLDNAKPGAPGTGVMGIIGANLGDAMASTPVTNESTAKNLLDIADILAPAYIEDHKDEFSGDDQTAALRVAAALVIEEDYNGVRTLAYALSAPTGMAADLNNNGLVSGLLSLYGRMSMANGIAAHPSVNGHKAMAAEVIATYGNYTAKDETIKNVNIVLDELYKLVEQYGPEVAAQVWAQWVEAGYVADVETSVNELKAMLTERYTYYTETALPAIDAAVLDLVAQKDALVVELNALNAELAAKKAELEKVISEQEISDIYVPNINIDAEVGNNEQTQVPEHECVVEAETIEAELKAAIKDIEHAIATIEALIADIEADIADMVALAQQIADAVAELEKTIQSIAVAADDLNNALIAVVDVLKNSNGVVDAVIDSFEAGRATVLAAANVLELTAGTAEEMIADIDTMIAKIVTDAEALYNKVLADLPAALAQMPTEMVYAIGIALYASQYVDVAAIDLALQAKAAEYGITEETLTEEYITAEIAKIAAEYGVTDETVLAKYNEITGKIDAQITEEYAQIEADTKAQIAALEADAAAKIATLEEELKGYQTQLAELAEDAAEDVKAGIQAQIDRVTADIATVNADLEHAVSHLNNAAESAYKQIVAAVIKIYEDNIADLKQQIAALEEQLKPLIEGIEGVIDAIEDIVNNAQTTIEQILAGNFESIEALKDALVAMGAEAVVELVESIVDQINAIFKKATSSDLILHEGFKYVAIGDGSAAPKSYVEKLEAALNVEAAGKGFGAITCTNYAKAGNTVAAERANLSDVTGADLITVGFSNVTFISDALATAGNTDWSTIVGEENVQYIDELLVEVDAKLAESIADAATRATLMNVVEAYAYSAVQYACELPELVNDIHAVNPDALVIVVGMYNPIEDVVIDLGNNTTLDISEYIDYLVKGVAVHGIAYAILTGNAIYVDAPAVDTAVAGKTLTLGDLLPLIMGGFADLYPTDNGHEYIKNQILNALDLTTGMLGDADSNGKIQTNDAKLILQYIVGIIDENGLDLSVCDVDGNGKIQTNDAKLILQYIVGIITKFPAEA